MAGEGDDDRTGLSSGARRQQLACAAISPGLWSAFTGLFTSRASRKAEIVALLHQLNVLQRKSLKRPTLNALDRLIFVILFRISPRITDVLKIVEPETVIRWHRSGFRLF